MSWPEKEAIAPGVVNMLRGNMGLKPGERLLVMSNLPRPADWQGMDLGLLEEMLERALLGRLIADVARAGFPQSPVSFLPFAATGSSGRGPDAETAARMRAAEVVLAITSYSLSHTAACAWPACRASTLPCWRQTARWRRARRRSRLPAVRSSLC